MDVRLSLYIRVVGEGRVLGVYFVAVLIRYFSLLFAELQLVGQRYHLNIAFADVSDSLIYRTYREFKDDVIFSVLKRYGR